MNHNKKHIDLSHEKSYNGVPCKDGEVLVPFLVWKDMQRPLDFDEGNMKTWKYKKWNKKTVVAVIYIPVAFMPVPQSTEDAHWQLYNADVHEYLNRYAGINDPRFVSLDANQEDLEDPDKHVKCLEYEACAEAYELDRYNSILDELLFDYGKTVLGDQGAEIVNLYLQGYKKKEIAEIVFPYLKKSQAYDLINKALKEAGILFNEMR